MSQAQCCCCSIIHFSGNEYASAVWLLFFFMNLYLWKSAFHVYHNVYWTKCPYEDLLREWCGMQSLFANMMQEPNTTQGRGPYSNNDMATCQNPVIESKNCQNNIVLWTVFFAASCLSQWGNEKASVLWSNLSDGWITLRKQSWFTANVNIMHKPDYLQKHLKSTKAFGSHFNNLRFSIVIIMQKNGCSNKIAQLCGVAGRRLCLSFR